MTFDAGGQEGALSNTPTRAIRVPGEITREALEVLRKADVIFLEEIRNAGLYDAIWQAFTVLLPVKTAYSDANRPLIPTQTGHLFRAKPATPMR